MTPIAVAGIAGGIGAGLSILGSMESNAKLTRQANENFNATLSTLYQKRSIDFENLQYQGDEVNRAIGAQLSQLIGEANVAEAQQVAAQIEKNTYGKTAARLNQAIKIKEALAADNIVQAGEASMYEVQSKLSTANYAYNSGVQQASIQRANMLNQRQGTFEMLAGAASTGMSFASAGYGFAKG